MAASFHRSILEQVREDIVDLALTGIDEAQIQVLKDNLRIERLDLGGFPCVAIYHGPEAEIYRPLNNAQEEIGYPVNVLMVDLDRIGGQPSQQLYHNRRLMWRQQIIGMMTDGPVMSDVCRATMSSRPVMVPREWFVGRWYSQLLFYCWAQVSHS